MPTQINPESRAKFILEFGAELMHTLLQREDVDWKDENLSIKALLHASNLFDAYVHMDGHSLGAH